MSGSLPPGLTDPGQTGREVTTGYRSRYVLSWVRGDAYISVRFRGIDGHRIFDWLPAPDQREWGRPGLMQEIADQWLATQRAGVRRRA